VDTRVGKVKDGRRFEATVVNNTAVLQEGEVKRLVMRFCISRDANGKPQALQSPRKDAGWFWPQAAVRDTDRLYVFLTQVERADAGGPFGFRLTSQWLGIVDSPLEPPTRWRVEQLPLPFTEMLRARHRTFGAALLKRGQHLYIYGVDDIARGLWRRKTKILSRAPLHSVTDFTT
jgi:hypothetical protein